MIVTVCPSFTENDYLINNNNVNLAINSITKEFKDSNNYIVTLDNEDKTEKVSSFKSYLKILTSHNIILDHERRKNIIVKKMNYY